MLNLRTFENHTSGSPVIPELLLQRDTNLKILAVCVSSFNSFISMFSLSYDFSAKIFRKDLSFLLLSVFMFFPSTTFPFSPLWRLYSKFRLFSGHSLFIY